MKELKIFAGRSHPELAREICAHVGVEPGQISFVTFSNENLKIKIEENVRECDVFVIQTSCSPVHDHLLELLIMIDALKYASAARITAVLPYYPYVRSDKKDEPRISVTARLVADLLQTAGAHRILTMNLHASQIVGFSHIPVDHLDGIPVICDYLKTQPLENFAAVATDVGRAKVTEAYARRLHMPVVILDKRRYADDEKAVIRHVIGDVSGKNAIFFDDEILTGGSIFAGIDVLRERGAMHFKAACVHGVLARDAVTRLENSVLEELVITNTLPQRQTSPKIKTRSIAQLFGEAIKAIHTGSSVSRLFS
ncbi:ribose-phosphate diphosphokinase [Candidatus Acetothermia bacterium]|nr:ribose-phosphate diphosphokinase [Candidatus Acetothermia bacterium]MBI3659267.1 ribose-phosphate diphosphokinase [Candidatus Acetothermia bacterium]